VHKRIIGGYAVVSLIANYGLVAFRDPHGIRPLVFGERKTAAGSEIRDVKPGEAIYISTEGELHTRQCAEKTNYTPCIFEHVYFARPDSIIDGISVYKARLRQGEKLADKILRERPEHDILFLIVVVWRAKPWHTI